MTTAYIALGSNLGDRLGSLSRAVDAIAHLPSTHVDAVSHAYESLPAYLTEQPPYLNAVIRVDTSLPADVLLSSLQRLEDEMGRVRQEPNGARTIDLDILLYGAEEWQTEALVIPHPRLLERDFVVTPLYEIAPGITLPDGTPIAKRDELEGPIVRDYGRVPDAGLSHNMPIEPTEWVAVAEGTGPQTALGGFDAGLMLKRQVLAQEGIPHAFEPFEPGLTVDFLGRPEVFRLVVPEEFAQRAVKLLDEIEDASELAEEDALET